MRKTLLAIAALALLLSGCVGMETKPMEATDIEGFKAGRSAMAFVYPEKRLSYQEEVYKVFYIETRGITSEFAGMWDIDRDLSHDFARGFQGRSIDTTPIDELLTPEQQKALQGQMAAYRASDPDQGITPFSVPQELRQALLDQGIDYLISARGLNIHITAYSLTGLSLVYFPYALTVTDLRTNQPLFNSIESLNTGYDFEDSAREIEQNGLKGLRELFDASTKATFGDKFLPKTLGLVKDDQG